jgi:hypothetical protein
MSKNILFIIILLVLFGTIGVTMILYNLRQMGEEARRQGEKVNTIPEKLGEVTQYLHPNVIINGPPISYKGISSQEAISFALYHLQKRGIKRVLICEVKWIGSPLGGFLIDSVGSLDIGDNHYSTFRIGVRDGSEGDPGKEFVFIARGTNKEGRVIWYPEPGPDFQPIERMEDSELLAYEFLKDREHFETLLSRCK